MNDERIGRYRLLDVSGTGSFATVYRAEDKRLGDTVAVKVLAENHSLDAAVRERFLREGRAMRKIDSPHVVAVHDLGETERQQPYLVMQYADRGTLADRVAARRRDGWAPTAEDIRSVSRSLAEAITAAHQAQIVHRDLSPKNILLRSTGTEAAADPDALIGTDEHLLVADLGLCKDLALHSGLTLAGGTDGFRPPEQRDSAGFISPAADLWSLSALIAWLITEAPPEDETPVAPQVTALGFPEALGRAVDHGLATEPDDRPATAWGWYGGIYHGLGPPPDQVTAAVAAADPAAPDRTTTRPGGPRPSLARRGRLLAGLGVVVVAMVIGAAVLAVRDGGGPTVTELDDGSVMVEASTGTARLAITGPDEVDVGETVTFEAEREGIEASFWRGPDGTVLRDRDSLTFATASAGRATVALVGITEDGEVLEVEHAVAVR